MSTSSHTGNKHGPRASWLAGEATWISHAETLRMLPALISGMSTALIADEMKEMYEGRLEHQNTPMTPFWMANAGLTALSGSIFPDDSLRKLLPGTIRQKFHAHTFEEEPDRVMAEGLKTIIHYPINLLFYANAFRPQKLNPLFSSIEDIASIYKSDWFYREMAASAQPSNGYWGEMSLRPLYPGELQALKPRARFTYRTVDGASRFGLHDETVETIRKRRAARNASALEANYEIETNVNGSTVGCPGVRRRAKIENPDIIRSLATAYSKDPEDITAPFAETAIKYGLQQLAEYLGTVALIDKTIR